MKAMVCTVETPEAWRQACALRTEIFVAEQGIDRALERDGLDAAAHHVLLFADGEPAATGRVLLPPGGPAVLARIAVRAAFRGRGLGARVVAALEAHARQRGARTAVLHPHDYLEPFYRRLGYGVVPGIRHAGGYRLLTMTKLL